MKEAGEQRRPRRLSRSTRAFSQRSESFSLAMRCELPTWVEPRGQLGKWGRGRDTRGSLSVPFPGKREKKPQEGESLGEGAARVRGNPPANAKESRRASSGLRFLAPHSPPMAELRTARKPRRGGPPASGAREGPPSLPRRFPSLPPQRSGGRREMPHTRRPARVRPSTYLTRRRKRLTERRSNAHAHSRRRKGKREGAWDGRRGRERQAAEKKGTQGRVRHVPCAVRKTSAPPTPRASSAIGRV